MVFVARYLVTIDRSLLSSPHPQLVPFVIVLFSSFFSYAFLTSSIYTPLNMFSLRAQLFSSFFFCSLICAFSPLHHIHFSSTVLQSLLYQGVFTSILHFQSLSSSPLYPSTPIFPLCSHSHATCWAATHPVFISFFGKRGNPVPAANGLLENSDSHASQSGEQGRERRRIWNETKRRIMLQRGSATFKKKLKPVMVKFGDLLNKQ